MRRLAALVLLAAAQSSVAETDDAGVPIVDDRHEIVASRLIRTAHGPVRVTEIAVRRASHAEAGHLTVTYLSRRDGNIVENVEYAGVVEAGSFGRMAGWTIDDRFSDWPVIVTEGGGTWQGQTCSWTILTELLPTGPIELATFQASLLTDGVPSGKREDVEGEIVSIERNKSFTVRYTGTQNFENTYRRGSSGVYVMEGEDGNVLEGC
jgi:hypothetical protein